MSRNNSKKNRLKYVFLAFAFAAAFAATPFAVGCKDKKEENNEDDKKTVSKEDTQLLKNGNFEFFTVPEKKDDENEPVYLINAPTNWTHGGGSSYTKSGIIGTSDTAWATITADSIADTLDYNNELDSSASDYKDKYVDYNGLKSSDLLYKDSFNALKKDSESETPIDRSFIENPKTHYCIEEQDGKPVGTDGTEYYKDSKGDYYAAYDAEKDEYSQPVSHVLMLHNLAGKDDHKGMAQNYSSISLSLPANTAAEISVWVKTAYLLFDNGSDVSQDRGASITVTQSVGGNTLDNFVISCINTEKLIREGKATDSYNGWVEYTVYVNACDFAESNVSITLGLGETKYAVEGYAFFDDVSVTKYASLDDSESYNANKSKLNDKNSCNLSSDSDDKIFKADSYIRNNNAPDPRNSNDFHYFVDLASAEDFEGGNYYKAVDLVGAGLTAGYTVDSNNYVSSTSPLTAKNLIGFTPAAVTTNKGRLPLDFQSLNTEDDLLGFFNAGYQFTPAQTDYYDKLNTALTTAKDLPKVSTTDTNNVLVMLSTYGTAYTSTFNLSFTEKGQKIISFWVKTSDMGGNTAATITLTEKGNKYNSTQLALDTSHITTDLSDEQKDIFNGWVQCFFFVKNEIEDTSATNPVDLIIDVKFGNTDIKGTTVDAYKGGWVAVANVQTLDVDSTIFAYAGSGDHTASLSIVEDTEKKTTEFDKPYGSLSHEINSDMATPSSYTGVNGNSSMVVNNGQISLPFDNVNDNEYEGNTFAGLINKDNFIDGDYNSNAWYSKVLSSFNVSAGTSASEAWDKIFGSKSLQPLVINNVERTYGDVSVVNYGYIGADKSVSLNSYGVISVRVKASANAIAYVYLVDTSAGKNVISFSAPKFSFYYDEDGNVLKAKPEDDASVGDQKANILYTLRDDGLYQDKSGKLYANTWNYIKLYSDETQTYFDKDGNAVSFDKLVKGETYYKDAAHSVEANHFLITDSKLKIYEFIDGAYYYIVNGETQKDVITPFDTQYARYDNTDLSESYVKVIKGSENSDWVTVNFVIHAGSVSKNYRLEVWSGARDEYKTEGNEVGGTIIFDYSYVNFSDDTLKNWYANEIIRSYQNALAAKGVKFSTSEENITYYEKLAKENLNETELAAVLSYANISEYTAYYYTYSLYDSVTFQPFNKEVADDSATGYEYSVAEQTETLVYLSVRDDNTYTIFADYSAVDKVVNYSNPSTDDDDENEDKKSDANIWLLASSIILVIALLFAMASIFIKDLYKKSRRNKVRSNNTYKQTGRHMRKQNVEADEAEGDDDVDDSADGE